MDIRKEVAKIQESAKIDPRFKKYEEDLEITDSALEGVNKLFNSILPHFPAWRQSCPTDDDLSRLKLVWTKALMRNKQSTGKNLNLKAGITACEESDTDWLPSVGKFIKWCEQENGLLEFAQRALDLFNSAQKQVDSIGQMVVSKHSFNLKQMKAEQTSRQFIELYLKYAENNAIEPLEAFALAETVKLSPEQLKDKQKRTQTAQNECLNHLHGLFGKSEPKPVEQPKKQSEGVAKGSLRVPTKSVKQLDEEKQRQLDAIKHRGVK